MKVQAIGHNGKGRGSRFIRWATRGRFSHESIRFIDIPDHLIRFAVNTYGKKWAQMGLGPMSQDHEFESIQGIGVHHQPFFPSENQSWFDFEHTEEQAEIMFMEACRLVGCKYDWRGIGGFLTRRNRQNPLKWFCSEYGCHLRKTADIITQNMPCSWISPNVSLASVIFTESRTGSSVIRPL